MLKYGSRRFYIELAFLCVLYAVAGYYFIRVDAFERISEFVGSYEFWQLDEFVLLLLLSPSLSLWLCIRFAWEKKQEVDSRHQQDVSSLEQLKFDPQTGLQNFRFFETGLDSRINSTSDNTQFVFYLLSFENYHQLCESHHIDSVDDSLLQCIAIIRDEFTDHYSIGRTGQNEISIAFECIGIDCYQSSITVLKTVMTRITKLRAPKLECSASIAYVRSADEGVNTRRLITKARSATFTRTGSIGTGIYVYDQEVENKKLNDLQLVGELRTAIEKDELELYYQPQVDLYLGLTVGSEALIRWNHPAAGLLTPDKFVHLLDHDAICLKYGEWLFRKAIKRLTHLSKDFPQQTVSINISASHIQHPRFFSQLTQALVGHSSLLVKNLVIEVTESFKLSDHNTAFDNMRKCKALGAKVSLDDFGTGYSSLNQLRVLPVDEIKIDRSFVSNILTDHNDFKLVSSILSLAENFELDVVTEGVENLNQIDKLLMIGCRRVQGYYYSKPVPEKAFDEWLEESAVQPAIL
jgi:EAL domain-containing protein (putative c-di-GMP-specific phosphodiesterase class I)